MKNQKTFNLSFAHTLLPMLLLGVHAQSFAAAAPTKNPYTLTPLQVAIAQGYTNVTRTIIEKDPTALAQKDCLGWTPLHFAVKHGHQALAQYLIEKDLTLLTQKDNEGWTPLHVASANGYLGMVQCILDKNPTTLNQQNNNGLTPVYIALTNKHHNIAIYMVNMNNVLMPLHSAAKQGLLDVAQYIIERNPADLTQVDVFNLTPLHIATIEGHLAIVRHIIEKYPSLITQKNADGLTPLHAAAHMGHLNIAQYIIEKDATTLSQKDYLNGWTPLHSAVAQGQRAIAKLMLKKNPNLCNQKDVHGQNPLHLAAGKGLLNIIKAILQTDTSIDFRAKTSSDGNIIDLIPDDKKKELWNLLKSNLLRLHQVNPADQHIQCPICLEAATECPDCQNITDPLDRIRLTPCCIKVLCEHDFSLMAVTGNLTCPHCRNIWTVSQ